MKAFAYPSYIGFGYTSCNTCHFNPLGNGSLTDYGRALSATEIADRVFQEDKSDEVLASQSGFLGPLGEPPSWLRFSGGYRGMLLTTQLEDSPAQRWIHMQAEGTAVVKLWRDRVLASSTFGYVPVPQAIPSVQKSSTSSLISREHYLGFRPLPMVGVYAGFLDHAFGIRVPDHSAYIRSKTLTGMNDQTHGVLLYGNLGHWEGGIHFVLGNLFQDSSLRQKGITTMVEYEALENVRLGVSALLTGSDFRTRKMLAIHSRVGIPKGHSLLAEVGIAREITPVPSDKLGDFVFLQAMIRLARGWYCLMTAEQFAEDFYSEGARLYRVGPSVQYLPTQRVELRMDLTMTRTLGLTTINPDALALMTQLHLWL